jgi:hypothetical protein
MLKHWMLAAFLTGILAGPALAQQGGAQGGAFQQPEVAPACAADVKRVCPGIRPGSGKITECLKKNAETLAPDCKATVAEGRTTVPPSPCKADIEKLCPSIEPGAGRIGECLRKNSASLSAACRVYQVRIKD